MNDHADMRPSMVANGATRTAIARMGRVAAAVAAIIAMLLCVIPATAVEARAADGYSAVKAVAECTPTRFTDLAGASHREDIDWLSCQGITKGYDNGDGTVSFGGMRTVVRQDMAAFLYRMAGSPDYTPSAHDRARFTDVNESTSHAREIWWLAASGISTGYPNGDGTYSFGGMRTVVRQDMAAFLHRFAQQYPGKVHITLGQQRAFTDVNDGTSHKDDIIWLAQAGITTGYGDGSFGGMRDVVRQDMAAFLHRMVESGGNVSKPDNGNNSGTTTPDVTVPWNGTDDRKVEPGKTLSLAVDGLKGAAWSSSNPKAATVDQNGTVTGKGVGQALITANLNGKEYSCWLDIIYHYKWYFLNDYRKDGIYSGSSAIFVYAQTNDPDGTMNLGMSIGSDANNASEVSARSAQRSTGCLNDPAYYTDIAKVAMNVSPDDPCPSFRKVQGGYVGVAIVGDTAGSKTLTMYRHRDNEDPFYAPVLNIASFKVNVTDYSVAENAWIDQLVKDHTTTNMTPVQKMDAIAKYLTSDEAGFTYVPSYIDDNGERDGAYLAVGPRAQLQPYWKRRWWDSRTSPSALAYIANRIGGWDDTPVSLYGKYAYGTEEWYEWHSYMEATYKGEKHQWSVVPTEDTGYMDSIPTLDFSDTSWMHPVTNLD